MNSSDSLDSVTSRITSKAIMDFRKAFKTTKDSSGKMPNDELSVFSLSFYLLEKIKRKSGLKKRHIVLTLLGLLGIYLILGSGAVLVCNTIGVLYPAWMTVRSMAQHNLASNIEWLTYWLVFGVYTLVDNYPQEGSYTFYWVVKTMFLVWCMGGDNCNRGTLVIYNYLVKYLVQLEKGFNLESDWKTEKLFNRKLDVATFWAGVALFVMYLVFGTRAAIICNLICFLYPAKNTLRTMATLNLHATTKWLTYWFVYSVYNLVDQLPWLESNVTCYWAIKSLFLMWVMCDGAHMIHRYYLMPLCELEKIYTEEWVESHPFGGYDILQYDNDYDSHSEDGNYSY
ncbi:hypothetical protein WDU94_011475 [Cyamophila willieti]